jgi:DHA2 family multidrug resistance protein
MIANSIVLPIAAWLGTRLGRKKYFTGAIVAFTVASFMCGIAPNLYFLVFFRIIQGLAGGALLPTSQTLIQESFPPEKAGLAMAVFGISVMVGPALGPTLGGYLTDNFGWRSIFNVNVPVGIFAATMAWMNVGDVTFKKKEVNGKHPGVDWTGLGLLSLGIGSFQYVLERGQADGWFDSKGITTCVFLAVIGISSFIYWELKVENPIMNLRLFKSNILRSGTMLMLALGIMVYSLTFAIPVFVANVMPQMSATRTGNLFMPGSIVTALFMFPVGMLLQKVSPKILVLIGLAFGELSVLYMSRLTTQAGPGDILFPLIIRGVAMAFLFIPINQMVLGAFRGEELGQVSGMQNFFRQIGGSIGIASLDTLLTRFSAQHYNDLLSRVNSLNPTAYHDFVQGGALAASKMPGYVGFWNPQTLAVKSMYGRIAPQIFVLSFSQLCWTIIFIFACGLIPLYLIKPKKMAARALVDAH